MTSRLVLITAALLAVPCAYSQGAPASAPTVTVTQTPGQDVRVGQLKRTNNAASAGEGGTYEFHRGPGPDGDIRQKIEIQRGEMRDGGMGMPGDGMPPGTWWRSQETIAHLSLSLDQQKRIEDFFLQSRVQLIDLHASLEKEELLLEPLLNANPVDQGKAMAQISKIADTRAELEKTNAKMLLNIRAVLSVDQWTKLRERRITVRPATVTGTYKMQGGTYNMQGGRDGGHQPPPPPPPPQP
jgi:Spy/CpxP family protein refolding chaperone